MLYFLHPALISPQELQKEGVRRCVAQVCSWALHPHTAVKSRKPHPLQSNILHCKEGVCALEKSVLKFFVWQVSARGRYLLGIIWSPEQADVPVRPIHHIQKTADTASSPCFPHTHSYPAVRSHDI